MFNILLGRRQSKRTLKFALFNIIEYAGPQTFSFISWASEAVMITTSTALGFTPDTQVPRKRVWSTLKDAHALSLFHHPPFPPPSCPTQSKQGSQPLDQPSVLSSGQGRKSNSKKQAWNGKAGPLGLGHWIAVA